MERSSTSDALHRRSILGPQRGQAPPPSIRHLVPSVTNGPEHSSRLDDSSIQCHRQPATSMLSRFGFHLILGLFPTLFSPSLCASPAHDLRPFLVVNILPIFTTLLAHASRRRAKAADPTRQGRSISLAGSSVEFPPSCLSFDGARGDCQHGDLPDSPAHRIPGPPWRPHPASRPCLTSCQSVLRKYEMAGQKAIYLVLNPNRISSVAPLTKLWIVKQVF